MAEARNASQLKIGEKGIIAGFKDEPVSLKLMEMGCLPGVEISMSFTAPLGDPMCISVSGYHLALRKDEATMIYLQ
ncbi:FeoA family protein [Cytophagales bacterium LB-30]|uniref:FeoA family protein n=1 Tax=Shiella aurantiaca TaxID=3058365 RepID=A0ABT8F630_9BACT|nr:FeoA family protein [Shiella aurantiaca]MDN4165829.1 FeoA family protein [Shiella aurantiaca]